MAVVANVVGFAVAVAVLALLPFAGRTTAAASVEAGQLRVTPVGLAKMWAARSKVVVPAGSVESIDTRPDLPKLGWRIGGTGMGGFCSAGNFRRRGTKSFAIVGRSRPLVEILLNGAKYDRIVFSAADPEGLVRSLRTKLGAPTSGQGTRRRA
jgi:uncharacterized membrane protein